MATNPYDYLSNYGRVDPNTPLMSITQNGNTTTSSLASSAGPTISIAPTQTAPTAPTSLFGSTYRQTTAPTQPTYLPATSGTTPTVSQSTPLMSITQGGTTTPYYNPTPQTTTSYSLSGGSGVTPVTSAAPTSTSIVPTTTAAATPSLFGSAYRSTSPTGAPTYDFSSAIGGLLSGTGAGGVSIPNMTPTLPGGIGVTDVVNNKSFMDWLASPENQAAFNVAMPFINTNTELAKYLTELTQQGKMDEFSMLIDTLDMLLGAQFRGDELGLGYYQANTGLEGTKYAADTYSQGGIREAELGKEAQLGAADIYAQGGIREAEIAGQTSRDVARINVAGDENIARMTTASDERIAQLQSETDLAITDRTINSNEKIALIEDTTRRWIADLQDKTQNREIDVQGYNAETNRLQMWLDNAYKYVALEVQERMANVAAFGRTQAPNVRMMRNW